VSAKNSAAFRLAVRIVSLSRLSRILLAALFALAITLMITPVVDGIYLNNFFSSDTRMIPALVSTALGLGYYGVGWRLIVGYVGEKPIPRPAVLWYFGMGAAACIIVLALVFIGAVTGSME
jgi:hypothetical protein